MLIMQLTIVLVTIHGSLPDQAKHILSPRESRQIKSFCFEELGTKSFVNVLLLEFGIRDGRSPSK